MATHSSIFLPVEFHGQRSLAGSRPRGRKGSDTTEVTQHTAHYYLHRKINVNIWYMSFPTFIRHSFVCFFPLQCPNRAQERRGRPYMIKAKLRLPAGTVDKNALQTQRTQVGPRSRKIPHATGQRSSGATATEPTLQTPRAATAETSCNH